MSNYFNELKCLYSLLIMQVNVKMVFQETNLYSEWLQKSVKFASLPDKMTDMKNEMINFLSIFGFVVGRNTGYDFEHFETFFTIVVAVVYLQIYRTLLLDISLRTCSLQTANKDILETLTL